MLIFLKRNFLLVTVITLCILTGVSGTILYKYSFANTLRLTDEEKTWISNNKVIKVAGDPNYQPFDFENDKGERDGLSKDILDKIEKRLGLKFQYVKSNSWHHVLEMAKNKEIDVISNIGINDERQTYLAFTESFYDLPFYIISNSSNSDIKSLKDLRNKKILMPKEYLITDFIKKYYPEIKFAEMENDESIFESINFNHADATISELGTVSYCVKKKGFNNLIAIDEVDFTYFMRLGVQKDNRMLLHLLNKALFSINVSEYHTLQTKWVDMKFDRFYFYKRTVVLTSLIVLVISILLLCYFTWIRTLKAKVDERTQELLQIKNNLDRMVKKQTKKLNDSVQLLEHTIDEKNKLFSVISHDLKNSFSSLISITELMIEDSETMEEAEQKELLNAMKTSSKETYDLLLNLLDWSRSKFSQIPLMLKEIDLFDLSKDVLKSVELQADKKKIHLKIEGTSLFIYSDHRRIETILRNLLSNAIKYTEDKGEITVRLNTFNKYAMLTIEDNGIGMDNNLIESIFKTNSLNSSKGTKGELGTGIGLTIVKQFVHELGGIIEIESEIGLGTIFRVMIPLDSKKEIEEISN